MENILDGATLDIVLRLFVALALGMIIGTERVWAHKTAGMRTYALVAMGSALFVIISNEMVKYYANFSGMNPLMIVSQIVVGVGFIGAGLIFTNIALIATILTLFIFIVLWFIEKRIKKSKYYKEDTIEDLG